MSYWHESATARYTDDIQRAALEVFGLQVEDVWEREVNTVEKVDAKMREILFGAPKMGTYAPIMGTVCPYCGDPHCVRWNFEV